MKPCKPLGLIGLALLALLAHPALAEGYANHGRVSVDDGSNLVKGSDDKDWSHATVNTLILPGDTLWVDEGGTSEVEFSGGSFLRGADGTKVEVYALPPTALLRAWSGSMYIQRLPRSGGDFTVESPAAKIYIDPDSIVRVDVVGKGATTVSVHVGAVLVKAADGNGAVRLDAGERAWIDPGFLPSEPTPFNMSEEDALDSWNRERMALLAGGGRTVPKEVVIREDTIGVSDLNQYGEWVYVENRYAWRPTVVVNYVPYRYGYWSTVPTLGSCWIGEHPFSYVTTHYGRWNYHHHYGWLWAYDPVWSPAWCATVRVGDYYCWSPIGWDYRPITYGSAHFSIGGVNFWVGATSYVPVSYYGWGPRYVYGCYPEFRHYADRAPINIWNINFGDRGHVNVPYSRDLPVDRDYTPRRSIRGIAALDEGGTVLASDRVRQLEGRLGRTSFATNTEGGTRGGRTVNAPESRTADVRRVSLAEGRTGRGLRGGAAAEPVTLEPRVGRAADPDSGRPADEAPRPRVARGTGEDGVPTLTNDDARSARPLPTERSRATVDGPASTAESGDRGAVRGRGEAGGRSEAGGRADASERSEPRGESRVNIDGNVNPERPGIPSRGEDEPRRSPARGEEGGVRGTTREPSLRTVESDSEGGANVSRGRSTSPRRTVPPQDSDSSRAPAVNIRGRESSGPSVDDVPSRSRRSATSYTPEPQEAPRTRSVERPGTPSRGDAPVYNAPGRDAGPSIRSYSSEPRVERSAPRSVEPRYESPRQAAPRQEAPREVQRSAPSRVEAAPREMNVPTIQRSAPSSRGGEPRMAAPDAPRGGSPRGGEIGGGRGSVNRGSIPSNGGERRAR